MDHCHQWSMLSPHLPVFPFICLSIYPTIYPFIQSSPSIYLPIYLSTFLSIHPLFLLTKHFSCSPFLLVKSLCCVFLTCISFSWHCSWPVTKLYLAFCNPMNCSTPGFPVHHQLPEFTQTHVHWVGDAIQPSHPLSSPSPPTFNLSQHQGFYKWVSSSHQVAKVLEHQPFQWIFRTDFL